jgi:hypothetical protein
VKYQAKFTTTSRLEFSGEVGTRQWGMRSELAVRFGG